MGILENNYGSTSPQKYGRKIDIDVESSNGSEFRNTFPRTGKSNEVDKPGLRSVLERRETDKMSMTSNLKQIRNNKS